MKGPSSPWTTRFRSHGTRRDHPWTGTVRPTYPLAAVVALFAVGCGDSTDPTATDATAVHIEGGPLAIDALGVQVQLSARVGGVDGISIGSGSVAWRSTAPAVATVSQTGLVRTLANGSTEIVASVGAVADTTSVSVDQVPVTLRVSLDRDTIPAPGVRTRARASAKDRMGRSVAEERLDPAWSVDDPSVAGVDAGGVVTGRAAGATRILARGPGPLEAAAAVVVQEIEAPVDTAGTWAVVGATVLPMTVGRPRLEDHTVVVRDGRIAAVGHRASTPVPDDAFVVDGADRFVVPGLADMHTHIATETTIEAGEEELLLYLANGVTTVLNQGDFGAPLPTWAVQIRAGERLGPTLYLARYARGRLDGTPTSLHVEGADAARTYEARARADGYHFIKLYNYTQAEAARTFLQLGAADGLPSIGHPPQTMSFRDVVGRGLRMVAHAGYGGVLVSDMIWNNRTPQAVEAATTLLAGAGVRVNATLAVEDVVASVWGGDAAGVDAVFTQEGVRYAHPSTLDLWNRKIHGQGLFAPPGSSPGGRDVDVDFIRAMVRSFHEGGVSILVGSDSPTVLLMAGFSIHRELEALRETLDVPPAVVLEMATAGAGRFIEETVGGVSFGTVEVGSRADLLVLEADPTVELGHLRRRAGVLARGRWLSEARFLQKLDSLAWLPGRAGGAR